jgi:drug/metabolite transporter (DMT)-like permease
VSTLSPGFRAMIAGAFFFSLMSALVKVAGARFPTFELVFARSLVVLVISGVALARSGTPVRGREPRLLVLRGVLGFTALSCFYYAVIHLPLAEATVIQYTNPVWTTLIAAVVLREWIGGRQVGLALLSLAGVVLVARPGALFGARVDALDPGAVGVALAGAIFSAAAYVTVRRLKGETAMVVVFHFAAWSTALSLPMLLRDAVMPRGWDWGLLLAIGVTTHLGQIYLTLGLQREAAGRAMTVAYLQIVFAALLGIVLFGDVPGGLSILGAALIVVVTILLARTTGPATPWPPSSPTPWPPSPPDRRG